jgi:hypothetical protein
MGSGIMINRSHLLNYFILHFTSEKKKKKSLNGLIMVDLTNTRIFVLHFGSRTKIDLKLFYIQTGLL